MKSKFLLFLILALTVFGGHHATASTCTPLEFDEAVKKADIIFLGKVIERTSLEERGPYGEKYSPDEPECGSKIASFDVYKVWKGDLEKLTTVYSKGACFNVGSYFKLNHLYFVFANKSNKKVDADYMIGDVCDGTKNLLHMGLPMIDLINDLDALSSE